MSKHGKSNHKHEEHSHNNEEEIMDAEVCENEEELGSNDSDNSKDNTEDYKKKSEQYYSMFLRVSADFDNFKKRTVKERESTYQDATSEAVQAFLPVLDNFERALKAQDSKEFCENESAFITGIELLFRQFKEAFVKINVKEINCIGQKFDPNLHNAVMHIDDDSYGEGEIIEELQRGYLIGEKVIRHSMVKVAN